MEEISERDIWNIAKSINESDGLIPSNNLKELIEKNIEDKITTEEIINKLKEKYKNENI